MTEGSARWGGPDAPTTLTTVDVRCKNCGSYTALRLSGEEFVCRDTDYCELRTSRRRRNLKERKKDNQAMYDFLERLRRS